MYLVLCTVEAPYTHFIQGYRVKVLFHKKYFFFGTFFGLIYTGVKVKVLFSEKSPSLSLNNKKSRPLSERMKAASERRLDTLSQSRWIEKKRRKTRRTT